MGQHINLGVEVLFAPWDDTTSRYLALVSGAEREVVISIYGFHLPKLTELLIAHHQAGRNIAVILDHTQAAGTAEAAEVARLAAAGVPHIVGTSPEHHQILHSKMTIVDGHLVECGSWNYSLSASQQLNDLHIIDSAEVALEYLDKWERVRDFILQAEWALQAPGTIIPATPAELPADPVTGPSTPSSPAASAPLVLSVAGASPVAGGGAVIPPAVPSGSVRSPARSRAARGALPAASRSRRRAPAA